MSSVRAKAVILTEKEIDRFWDKVVKTEGCWLWAGTHHPTGYAIFSLRRGDYKAHRVAYVMTNGEPDPFFDIDHLCRNRGCVNPSHLEAVTHKENVRRGESPIAKNFNKTHCVNGHLYTEENTVLKVRGGKQCRACMQEKAKYYCANYKKSERGVLADKQRKEKAQKVANEKFTLKYPDLTYSPELAKALQSKANGALSIGPKKKAGNV